MACKVIVPGAIVDHWRSLGKTQLIAELELLQILVFFQHYRSLCKNRRVLLFVDNNAIRDAIAKGTSKSLSVMIMLSELHRVGQKSRACAGKTHGKTHGKTMGKPWKTMEILAGKPWKKSDL